MLHLRNSNQDPLINLYDLEGSYEGDMEIDSLTKELVDTLLMGDGDSSTNPTKETNKFINSSVDDLVPIPKESEVTSDSNLECDMPVNTPLPTTDVREENFDIKSPLGEQVVDFLMENEDVVGLPRHLVKRLFSHLVKNLSSTKRMFDEPLGDDLKHRSYDVTFSNPLFDFNDDFILCNDNSLFDEEYEDISSLDPPESTLVIDESTLLVTPPPASMQLSLRKVERFDPFFSLT
uniref:NAC domain-containing protein n=1 Tax=Tanacetum cinerariifolium TaxID=118510 RepID=A0A699H1T8_TANCI|nr:NAC domain-containing protein [Tanacetum cinerariifolium]